MGLTCFYCPKSGIAWKATLLVTEVHTRRRRGCPRIENYHNLYQAWKAVPDFFHTFHDFSRCTALQAVEVLWALFPAHPRFTRMYGVTNSIAFQAILNSRNLNSIFNVNLKNWLRK